MKPELKTYVVFVVSPTKKKRFEIAASDIGAASAAALSKLPGSQVSMIWPVF